MTQYTPFLEPNVLRSSTSVKKVGTKIKDANPEVRRSKRVGHGRHGGVPLLRNPLRLVFVLPQPS